MASAGIGDLRIALSSLKLTGSSAAVSVCIELDLPGEDEPLRSEPVPLQSGAAALSFDHSYPMGRDTELRAAVTEAMRTTDRKDDSEVLFAVLGFDAAGGEVELGVASYELEELLEQGRDQPSLVLDVTAGKSSRKVVLSLPPIPQGEGPHAAPPRPIASPFRPPLRWASSSAL